MSELKTVYSKLFKTELASQKVELATIYDNIQQTIDDSNKDFFSALDLKNKAANLSQKSLDKNRALLKELNRAETLIKDLGIDSELKKVQDAKVKVESAIKIIDKAITVLLSV